MSVHPVEIYLKNISEIYRTYGGTKEESYYGALESFLNAIGRSLKPKIRCVLQLQDTGAGEPDFGLYSSNQFLHGNDERPLEGQLPERGVIEAKGWKDDIYKTAETEQVKKYLEKYKLILVTNYREFLLLGIDDNQKQVVLEFISIAKSAELFHSLFEHPQKAATDVGDRLVDFLRRVMLYTAPLDKPQDLAWFLASHAREARHRIDGTPNLPELDNLRKALENALGMKFTGDDGEHFFRATLVQTLFYGVFSAWVLWSRENPKPDERFNWRVAGWMLHVPMIGDLYTRIATPKSLKPLGLDEVLDRSEAILNRVDRIEFFKHFEEEHAVQYFYEPFLRAYDPVLRKDLGVWYTPPEIVRYQVERVDRVLREELDITDGLADNRVVVLDPCCGTGAYLVETLRRIHRTLLEKGDDALMAQRLKKAALERVLGFEILPAPFVIAHLQIGLMLRMIGAPLVEENERAGVFLTNALTGWEKIPTPTDDTYFSPEFEKEREAADHVKRDTPILVVIGNPPYNAFAGTSPAEEAGLVEPYKEGLAKPISQGGWGIKKFNLDDLYVRFFRIAERRIVKSGKGIVSFISNYSWTMNSSYVVLRKHLLKSFDAFWIENMHGNRKISEYAPDGKTSETIFSIPGFSPGIQQGIVISLWIRRDEHIDATGKNAKIFYRNNIDAAKAADRRKQLLDSLNDTDFFKRYDLASPNKDNRYEFLPSDVSDEYRKWPSITDLCSEYHNGLMEKRGGSLINIDKNTIENQMRMYFNETVDWESFKSIGNMLATDAARFNAKKTREKILKLEIFNDKNIKKYLLRPYDLRWCYYSKVRPLWNEPRPNYWSQCWAGNRFFVCRPSGVAIPEGIPFYVTPEMGDNDAFRGHAYYFPFRLRKEGTDYKAIQGDLNLPVDNEIRPNISATTLSYLQSLSIEVTGSNEKTASLIWYHALAIGFSPAYLSENADGIRQDWPRIPFPSKKDDLFRSSELGRRVAELLDTETPVSGVTSGEIRPELKGIAAISKNGGGVLNPTEGHLDLSAGWGHAGKDGVCMPGKGKIESVNDVPAHLRDSFNGEFLKIFLNDTAFWANVPRAVWEFYIGGYQVIKKWLSYREKSLLGRGLTFEEVDYVTGMMRRLTALVLLQDELDANYHSIKSNIWKWPMNN